MCSRNISTGREDKKVRPCLFSSYRLNVLLIGIEGFPHSGFRHFIRYVNIRGITPERQGEDKRMIKNKSGRGSGTEFSAAERSPERHTPDRHACRQTGRRPISLLISALSSAFLSALTWDHVLVEQVCCSPW